MDEQKLREEIAKFSYWYHRIELAPGVVTPGFHLEALWEHLRSVRDKVDYRGKVVLDIASFDGMFAFEAEKKGARLIVATDCLYRSFQNFMFCRNVFKSNVIPLYNVSPYNLTERLDVYFDEQYPSQGEDRRFDVVQHFGLLYHLRDPLRSLSQARSVMKPGAKLIIETDVVLDVDDSIMLFNGLPNAARVRDNYSVWWAPTRRCLIEMLESTLFVVEQATYSEFLFEPPASDAGRASNAQRETMSSGKHKTHKIGRGAVVATAIMPGGRNEKFEQELSRTYRNPGLDKDRMGWTSCTSSIDQ
jgi:tRNA (mo5U34)-methyltransferase